jgi:hypothetical protein
MNFDANGEDCPMGDDCSIHFRIDEEILENEYECGRIISYIGDWAVVTDENQDLHAQLKWSLIDQGIPVKDQPDRYETTVTLVGKGSLGDLYEEGYDATSAATRYIVSHDSWDNFKEAHNMVADAVQGGSITLDHSAL